METIGNTVDAVKKSIWPENAPSLGGGTTETHKSMIDDTVTTTNYGGKTEKDPMAEGSYDPDKSDVSKRVDGQNFQDKTNSNSMSNSNEPNSKSGVEPSVDADPNSAQQPTQKQQGADRPTEKPTGSGDSEMSTSSSSAGSNMGGGMGGGMKLPDDDNEHKSEGTGTKYEKSTGFKADGGDFDATRPGAAREADRLMDEKGIKHGDSNPEGDSGEPKKEKKWYGVDHSGFGGHGSHQNNTEKKSSVSSASGNEPDVDTNDGTDGTQKRGLVSKIKDKLHSSAD